MIGSKLANRYLIETQVSETPLSTHYLARDLVREEQIGIRVLKEPFSAEADFLTELGRVLEKLSAFVDNRLERLDGLEQSDGITFLVSEPPNWITIQDRLHKLATFSVAVSVATVIGVLEGLESLHGAGMVHGQLSSRTVAILPDGDAKLLEPGLWAAYGASDSAGAMMLGLLAPYLAPEIGRGGMPAISSDIYAVGVLLYEVLAGRYPFSAESPISMVTKHITDAVPSVRMMSPSVPHVVDEIIRKAMAKDPTQRYASAREMADDLRTVQDALRFGKTLTWPLNAAPTPVSSDVPEFRNEPKEKPRKPKEQPKQKPKEDPVQYEPDVPLWLRTIIWLFTVVLIVMLGGWIYFNLNRPAEIAVPELKRLSVAEARSRLDSLKLSLQVVGKEFSEEVPTDQILRTSPSSGEKIYEGRSVQAVVSNGSKFVEVPDLRGFTLDKAKAAAASVNLTVGDRVDEVPDRNVEEGLIVSQIPEPRIKVERFSPIRVKVSSGRGKGDRDPAEDTKYLYTVVIRLIDIIEPVNLRVDMTDSKGTKTVHESRRQPDERVEISAEGYGKKALFRLFYDGELVKQVEKVAEE